jgi:hypothetical protein
MKKIATFFCVEPIGSSFLKAQIAYISILMTSPPPPMGGLLSSPNSETQPDPSHEYFLTLQSLATSLQLGTDTRPALPTELVLYILRLARCLKHRPSRVIEGARVRVSSGGPKESLLWITSPPFDRTMIAKTGSMKLYTHSKDQGWANDPNTASYSWFDIGIFTTGDTNGLGSGDDGVVVKLRLKRRANDEPLIWQSHTNFLRTKDYEFQRGIEFGPEHEIWDYLDEGDVIGVYVCAQYPGWRNDAEHGFLDFWEWFEPMDLSHLSHV